MFKVKISLKIIFRKVVIIYNKAKMTDLKDHLLIWILKAKCKLEGIANLMNNPVRSRVKLKDIMKYKKTN